MQNQIPQGQTATIVCECQDAQLYRLIQNDRKKVCEGSIRLAWLNETKVYFVALDTFCQNIFPETPFVTQYTQKGVTLIFPHVQEGLCGIFLPASEPAQLFCNNLGSIIQLVPFENAMAIPQFKETIEFHCKDIATNPLENEQTAINYIQKGGEVMKQGFTWFGQVVASGINMGGDYLHSKIDKKDGDVQVSQDTKEKYSKTKNTISSTMAVTGTYLSQMFKPLVEKASELKKDVNQKIDTSDNSTLKQGKAVTVATWDATANALSGLGSALSVVGDSLGTNTRKVVEKKYGQDVSNTFLGGETSKGPENEAQQVGQKQDSQQQEQAKQL